MLFEVLVDRFKAGFPAGDDIAQVDGRIRILQSADGVSVRIQPDDKRECSDVELRDPGFALVTFSFDADRGELLAAELDRLGPGAHQIEGLFV